MSTTAPTGARLGRSNFTEAADVLLQTLYYCEYCLLICHKVDDAANHNEIGIDLEAHLATSPLSANIRIAGYLAQWRTLLSVRSDGSSPPLAALLDADADNSAYFKTLHRRDYSRIREQAFSATVQFADVDVRHFELFREAAVRIVSSGHVKMLSEKLQRQRASVIGFLRLEMAP